MAMLKLFGIVVFCGVLSRSQEVLSGLSCAVSPGAMQHVLSEAILHKGLLQKHMHGLMFPNIMSEGGLLTSPTSITGLHLVKVRLPRLLVELLPGVGVRMTIIAKLELGGNCLVGLVSELIGILANVNITVTIKCMNFQSSTFQVVIEDCLCVLGAIKTKLLSGLLSLSINEIVLRQLTATLPSLLCPVVDIVVNLANIEVLRTLNAVFPIGTAGTIHYRLANLPFTSGRFLGFDLDGAVKHVGGSIIPHDSSPSALPPLLDHLLLLVLRPGFLNAALSFLMQLVPQTFTCPPETFSGASLLQEAILALAPAECPVCRETDLLSIKLTLSGNPLILLEENKATVKLLVMIHVLVNPLDGPVVSLVLLKADLGLNADVSIVGGRLVLRLSLGSTALSLESSDVGISNVSSLRPHCSSLLVETILPVVNRILFMGIPLPNVMGIRLANASTRVAEGLLMITL